MKIVSFAEKNEKIQYGTVTPEKFSFISNINFLRFLFEKNNKSEEEIKDLFKKLSSDVDKKYTDNFDPNLIYGFQNYVREERMSEKISEILKKGSELVESKDINLELIIGINDQKEEIFVMPLKIAKELFKFQENRTKYILIINKKEEKRKKILFKKLNFVITKDEIDYLKANPNIYNPIINLIVFRYFFKHNNNSIIFHNNGKRQTTEITKEIFESYILFLIYQFILQKTL